MPPIIKGVLDEAAGVAARAMPKGIKIAFDKTNPEAVRWAREHAAELVAQNIIPESQQAIRDIIVRAFREGLPPREAAELIREHIGILPRHAAAVEKYRQETKAWFLKRGWSEAVATTDAKRLAKQYVDKLIRFRAMVIARTETMTAANRGQTALWHQAIAEDKLTEQEWERRWIVSGDERTCPICRPLDGKRAPINGVFPGGLGMPPAHPQCRCTTGLVRAEELPPAAEAWPNLPAEVVRDYPDVVAALGDALKVDDWGTDIVRRHMDDLAKMPKETLRKLRENGLRRIHVGNRGMPDLDDLAEFKGVRPRGWPEGSKWDDLPGCYSEWNRTAVAGKGGHGSYSVILHETGHAVADLTRVGGFRIDDTDVMRKHHRRLYKKLDSYHQQEGPGGRAGCQELFAEAIAVRLMSGRGVAVKFFDARFVTFIEKAIGL